jgi:hypothetical protein
MFAARSSHRPWHVADRQEHMPDTSARAIEGIPSKVSPARTIKMLPRAEAISHSECEFDRSSLVGVGRSLPARSVGPVGRSLMHNRVVPHRRRILTAMPTRTTEDKRLEALPSVQTPWAQEEDHLRPVTDTSPRVIAKRLRPLLSALSRLHPSVPRVWR